MPHKQLDAGALLLLLQHGDDLVEVGVGLAEGLAFRGNVAIMEAVEGSAELLHELEGHVNALDGHVHGVGAVLPRTAIAAGAERVGAGAAEGVPIGDREAQMLLHGLAFDNFRRRCSGESSGDWSNQPLRSGSW